MKCRLCSKNPATDGNCLTRVNPLGEIGVWECSPTCEHNLNQDELVLLAIEGIKEDE